MRGNGFGMHIRSQDFATGLLFVVVGVAALWIGADYPMGTAQRPGTGVLPRILAWCLIGDRRCCCWLKAVFTDGPRLTRLGVAAGHHDHAGDRRLRPAGRPARASSSTMLVSMTLVALGTPETRWREYALFALLMLAIGVGVFIYGLGMPIPILPKGFPWS